MSFTAPTATDNAGGSITLVLVTSPTAGLTSGAAFPLGVTTVTYTATDAAGNMQTASFTVTVGDGEAPVFAGVPANISQSTDAGLNTAVVSFTAPTATDNAGGSITLVLVTSPTAGLTSGAAFPLGVTTVTYTATDAAGNVQTASFTVTVGDGEAPVFAGVPANISQSTDAGLNTAVVSFTAPTATDNAGGSITLVLVTSPTAGLTSGAAFPLGVTTVTYTATDAAGNVQTASFTVTVTAIPPGTVTFVVNSGADGTYNIQSPEPVLNIAIVASSGIGRSPAIALRPGVFPVTFTVPNGISVESAQCSTQSSTQSSTLSAETLSGTIIITSGTALTCTIKTRDSLREPVAQIGQFLESRSQLILQNQPDLTRRIDRLERRYSNNGGVSGFGLALKNDRIPFAAQIGTDDVSFSYSLRQSRAKGTAPTLTGDVTSVLGAFGVTPSYTDEDTSPLFPKENIETAATEEGPTDTTSTISKSSSNLSFGLKELSAEDTQKLSTKDDLGTFLFDIWAEGTISRFEAGNGKGSFGVVHIGADYLIKPRVLLGLSVQGDWTNLDGQNAGSRTEGFGFLITPYVTAKLSDVFYFDARAGWGKAYNDVSPFGTYTDSFDSERWVASAALIGTWQLNGFKITPEARLSYFEENSESYTDSLNVLIPSVEVETGTFEFGPTFSKDFKTDKGSMYSPFLTVEGIRTFSQKNTATNFGNQVNLANEGVRARLEAGVDVYNHNGSRFNFSANYDGIGNNSFASWGLELYFGYGF